MKKFIFFIVVVALILHSSYAAPVANAPYPAVQPHSTNKITHKKLHPITRAGKKTNRQKSHSKKRKHKVHKIQPIPNYHSDSTKLTPPRSSGFPFGFANSIGHHLVGFVYKTVETLSYSVYKLGGTHFDAARGVYIVDCSEYVDYLLQKIHPHAYSSLVRYEGVYKPTTIHYYDFFKELSSETNNYWNKVEEVKQLEPGDILVFRNKHHPRNAVAGHIMVVMDKPIPDMGNYLVRVADSAPVGHSEDTRISHVSGIGIGTLLLKANPRTGEPCAYAWRIGSKWVRNVNFAMARPSNIDETIFKR